MSQQEIAQSANACSSDSVVLSDDKPQAQQTTSSQRPQAPLVDKETRIAEIRRKHSEKCLIENCSIAVAPTMQPQWESELMAMPIVADRLSIGNGIRPQSVPLRHNIT